mmetsp:Transcript_8255/g.7315  ORF Transcript_8255/g.7315 Transcript_8255/m.7315 type:complete len:178 (+) Transcript_8255:1211-1744(+)
MMPDLCLFNKRLSSFLVGFRNYLGKERFSDTHSGESVSIPNSNFMIITFPKILDNPDILETFLEFWNDVVMKKMKDKEKCHIETLIDLAETNVSKIYPVVYDTTFDLNELNVVCAAETFVKIPDLKGVRRTMLLNALNNRPLDYMDKKDKNATPVVLNNSYKPFNVNELDTGKIIYN